MKFVKKGDIVKVDYIGLIENQIFNSSIKKYAKQGKVYARSNDYLPLCFKVGDSSIINGFNDAVKGMQISEEKTVAILPNKAYGNYKKNLVRNYPLNIFEKQGSNLEAGKKVSLNLKSGILKANVLAVKKNKVTLDMNHEFAGKTLIFKIMLRDILPKE